MNNTMSDEKTYYILETIMLNRQHYERVTYSFNKSLRIIDNELEVMNYMKALELFTKIWL